MWFSTTSPGDPWFVAAWVPAAIYTIPPTSPLHHLTYVQVYDATPTTVSVGYTPGYLGTIVTTDGVVVYGTGYMSFPWVGNAYFPRPRTYGMRAQPIRDPITGMTFGFARGPATAWATEVWERSASYHLAGYRGAECCDSASGNVYGAHGRTSRWAS